MDTTSTHARGVLAGGLATFGLTAVHHVYGAVIYDTPWRHHAAVVGVLGSLALVGAHRLHRRSPGTLRGRLGLGALALGASLLAVLGFGVFEGFYNHVLKDLLYYAGLPLELHQRLFPPPTYELPNDFVFEATGVLQVVPAAYCGRALYRLVRSLGSARRVGAVPAQVAGKERKS